MTLVSLIAALIFTVLYGFFTSPQIISNTILLVFLCSCIFLPILVIWYIREKFGKSPEMPHGNIIAEYLKAKKRKVCPLIEYVD